MNIVSFDIRDESNNNFIDTSLNQKEKDKVYLRHYYIRNKEKFRQYNKKYRTENKEYYEEYRRRNKEHYDEYRKKLRELMKFWNH
jgi:hypothetical protein